MEKEYADDYALINKVLDIKKRYMNKIGIPLRYVFQLICCYEDSCPHPLCQKGKPDDETVWYEGGPPISFLPLPMKDDERPFGWLECPKCPTGRCAGHFLETSEVLRLQQSGNPAAYKPMSVPPSEVIKNAYKSGNHPGNAELEQLAKEVLLPVQEV